MSGTAVVPAVLVGVIGAGGGSDDLHEQAFRIGHLIARKGWVLVTGGLSGVMHHASRGASEAGGLVIGILPSPTREGMNPFINIPIVTAMGNSRNIIIAHTCQALISIGGEYGTISEMAISLKLGKPLVSIAPPIPLKGSIPATTPEEAVKKISELL